MSKTKKKDPEERRLSDTTTPLQPTDEQKADAKVIEMHDPQPKPQQHSRGNFRVLEQLPDAQFSPLPAVSRRLQAIDFENKDIDAQIESLQKLKQRNIHIAAELVNGSVENANEQYGIVHWAMKPISFNADYTVFSVPQVPVDINSTPQ